jgi:hypothetical protein
MFPRAIFPESYDVWLQCYRFAYAAECHHVHGDSHSLIHNLNTTTGEIEDTPRWDSSAIRSRI